MTQNPSRCFKTRKDGLISKAHVLHTLVPDAKVAFFACYEGKLFSYQSHEDWPVDPFSLEDVEAAPDDQKLPDHFATISVDRTSRNGSDSSLDLESYDDEVPFLDLEYQQHPEVPTPSRLPSIRPPTATPRSPYWKTRLSASESFCAYWTSWLSQTRQNSRTFFLEICSQRPNDTQIAADLH
ncbi:hypothetical protein CcaCcLH18_07587 [Colletotrichum camelliae]|nr:hypothetical protein CcaCcLH18_07587 [Colletotrichum camelliae]